MNHKYVVVVVALGDGTDDYGQRVQFHDFVTYKAAKAAAAFVSEYAPASRVKVIEDSCSE